MIYEKETFSQRLNVLMDERNLKQVDILNLTKPVCQIHSVKMNKSDISQYVAGKVQPSHEKLVVLAMALGVNEAWLLGFNVPRARTENSFFELDYELMSKFNLLSEHDKKIVHDLISCMIKNSL